ncbi:XRE family transcriptional regulator [Streptomyces sp. ActVer]|uniref:nSTAND1 domain-containing NTPase n=1 Tax=Streptomyces sp. ActVer TaxID=3014558 RepID=UPI0022B5BB65|nr:XRE family transcriptional regulator [Streptomyces sp. ActVer]MCZ4511680.1 XRE family transcriptional regulator [Streptomyces sp. ActVer]
MPRKERPLDAGDGPLLEFAADLRQLRQKAGGPPYRKLAEQAHYSISTLSSAASGQRLPTLAVTLAYVRACDGDLQEWERRWREVARHFGQEDSALGETEESGTPPYAGLRPFREQDAEWFFGREQLVAELAERLERQQFVMVIGASGSGKSSLLRAGLVPMLQTTATTVVLTPGPRPLEECAVRRGALAGLAPGALYRELREDPESLGRVMRQITARAGAVGGGGDGVVLVVDQFEETFTACQDHHERQCFIEALITAASAGSGRCRVVLGVRADFYAHCTHNPLLVEAMRDTQVPVGPMNLEELRRAVVRPAQQAGCTVEGGLLASLTAHAHGQAGMLPLLSHALLQTWRRRRGNALTLEAFEAAGGLEGSLARTAEEFYGQLEPAQRKLARRVFVRLTALGDGTEDTRRPTRLEELQGLAEQSGGADIAGVLDRAARARLLTLDQERVELAHEALIRCWPRLHGWLTEDRDALRILRQLTGAAHAWEALGRDPGALYRGTRLDMAAALDRTSLSVTEQEFLDASRAAADGEQAAARRGARRLRRLTVLLAVLLVTASAAAVYAVRAQGTATRQRNIALSQKVAEQATALRSTNPALATQLSLAAYGLAPTTEARSSLLSTFATPYATRLTGHTDNVNAVAYRADSGTLVTGSNDNTARLWNITDPHRPRPSAILTGHTEKVSHAAFSSDGRTLATASWDDTARLLDTTDPRNPHRTAVLRGHTGDVNAVAFNPEATALATASSDGTVRLWDATDPRHPRTTATLRADDDTTAAIVSLAFSPDGRTLAAAGFHRTVQLWTLNASGDARRSATLTGHTAAVSWVVFSPDGKTLASASWDRTVRLWNLASPGRPARSATLTGHTDGVRSVAISPDGRTLASASLDRTVGVWDISATRRPRRLAVLTGHTDAAVFVAFSPDSRTLASAGDDQTARLWDLDTPTVHGHTDTVCAVAISPDGRTLATGSHDRTARLWDITAPRSPRELATITGHSNHVNTVAFNPDGRTLATSGLDGTVRLWDVKDLRRPRESTSAIGHARGANAAVFSPDGTILATGGWDRTVQLWNVRDPRRPKRLDTSPALSEGVSSVAFSPDGGILATTEFGGETRLWSVAGRRLHRTAVLDGHVGAAYSPVFSPDGNTLATMGADSTARLWDTSDPRRPHALASLSGENSYLTAVFGPDGHTLVTAGADRTTRLWETTPERVADRVCRLSHPTITRSEWKKYFGNLAYRPPCP